MSAHDIGTRAPPPARSLRADDRGSFPVFEAVLVALLIFTAILFFTGIGRPTDAAEAGGIDLGQNAADLLAILSTRSFDGSPFADTWDSDAVTAGPQPASGWVTRLTTGLAVDDVVRDEVDALISEIVPTGALYSLRLSNGVEQVELAPNPDAPRDPQGARVAEIFVFPNSPYTCPTPPATEPEYCLGTPTGSPVAPVYGLQLVVWFGA